MLRSATTVSAFVLLLAIPAVPSSAVTVRAEFTGIITESSWGPGLYPPPSGFEVGASFSGFYEYDTEAFEDVDASIPGRLVGLPFGAGSGASVGWTIGSIDSSTSCATCPLVGVWVFDDFPGIGDGLEVFGDEGVDPNVFLVLDPDTGLGFTPYFIDYGVSLFDSDGTVFDSLSFPEEVPNLSDFESAALILNGYIEGPGIDPSGWFDVRGSITSLVFVPEPATASLLALGLVGLAVRRRAARAC